MPSKCISKLGQLWPASVSPHSLHYGLQVHLQTCSITATKVPMIMVFRVHISKLARSRPPSVCLNSVDYGLQIRTIMASKCISTLAQSRSRSVSPNTFNYCLQVQPQTRLITVSECISEFTRSSFSGTPRICSQPPCLRPDPIYCVDG